MLKKLLILLLTAIYTLSVPLHQNTVAQTLRYVVVSPVANIRMAPSLSADIVFVVREETEFLILSEVNDLEDQLWYRIQLEDSKEGFIASWVIDSIKTQEVEVIITDKVIIIDPGVRIREKPSLSSKIRTIVQHAVEKNVVAQIKDNENRTWYKIPMNDGVDAWVASWVVNIKISKEEKKSAADKLIVIGENVNIRKGPGTEFDLVTTVTSYMELRGIYESKDTSGRVWYMVRLPNNVEGWAASWVVDVRQYSEEKTPVSNKIAVIQPIVNVREGPSIQANIVRTIHQASEFPIMSQGNDINGKVWYEIQLDQQTKGWIASWVVTVKTTEAQNETQYQANIRRGPGTDFEKIGEASANAPIVIEGSAYTANNESWFFVSVNQQKGWILGSLLRISKNPVQLDTRLIGSTFTVTPNLEIPLYQGPDKNFSTLTSLQPKTGSIQIVGMANNIQNVNWAQVKTNDHKIGWIEAQLIQEDRKEKVPDLRKITGITWSKHSQGITIAVAFAEDGAYHFDTIVLQNPSRYVFDLPYAQLFKNEFIEQINNMGIISLRATQFSVNPNIVRLVVEMDKDLRYLSRKDGNVLIFEFSDYTNYEGPKLFINGAEVNNHLLLRTHQNQLYVPLFLYSNMVGSVLSWDDAKKEAVLLKNRSEYRFKADTRYAFIKSPEREARIDLDHPIATIDQVMHLALHDFSKVFNTSLSSYDNAFYIDNTLLDITYTRQSQSLVYVFHFSLPARCAPQIIEDKVTLTFHNAHLASLLKVPENPDLERINSQQRTDTLSSRTEVVFNLNQYSSYETAMLEDGHQFVFTLKPKTGRGIKGKTIIIDPGHGAFSEDGFYDVGAIGPTGLLESVVNLKIALKLKDLLESAGAIVVLTRDQEQNRNTLKLQERIEMANKSGADFYLCIHNNASLNPSAKGSEIYYYRPEDKEAADIILSSLVSSTGLHNRGSKRSGFAITKGITTMPSLLIECAFLSNPEEERMLQSDSFLMLIAEGLFNGLKAYFDSI